MQCHKWSKLWWNVLDLMIYLALFSSLTTQTSLLPFPKLFLWLLMAESTKIPQMIWNENKILARFHYSTCLVSLFDVHCTKVGWWLACFGNGESKREFFKSLMVGFVLQCSFCISLWKVNRRKDFFSWGVVITRAGTDKTYRSCPSGTDKLHESCLSVDTQDAEVLSVCTWTRLIQGVPKQKINTGCSDQKRVKKCKIS